MMPVPVPVAASHSKCTRQGLLNHLARAWFGLLTLSVASAVLTLLPIPTALLGDGILMLALLKCRIILARYLDLSASPAWLRGFMMIFVVFVLVIFGLYLV